MPSTTPYDLPYPDFTGLVKDGPANFQALAEAVAAKLTPCTTGTLASRPTSTAVSPGILGREYFAMDTNQLFKDIGIGWFESGTSPGDLKASARSTAQAGWLLCDGTAILRTGVNAGLFTAIGTTYGVGNGTTTFNIPDLRGRVPVGADGAAGRLSANDALGQSGGEEKHTQTPAELASHSHGVGGGGNFAVVSGGSTSPQTGGTGPTVNGTTNVTTSTGLAAAANVMQPFQVVNWFVKL